MVEKIAQAHMANGPKRPLQGGRFPFHPAVSCDDARQHVGGDEQIQDHWGPKSAIPNNSFSRSITTSRITTKPTCKKYRSIEAFAKEHRVDFYPAGSGIGHQIMVERGYVVPGSFVVASDSHSNMYGALGAIGTPIVRTDAAAVWATGEFWWQIPRTIQVVLEGKLREGVSGKDVIITLCGLYNHDEALNAAVEFTGPGVASLSMDARFSISNMSTEWGPMVGWFPVDAVTIAILARCAWRLKQQGIDASQSGD